MVAKTEKINARIEPELKLGVENILKKIGMTTTEAITVFFRQILMNKGIPFDIKIPNRETKKILREIQERKGLVKTNLDTLKKEYK